MTKLTVEHIQELERSLTPLQQAAATAMFIANGWRPGDSIPLYICEQVFRKAAQTAENPPS